jgi:hypothetical protein
MEHCRKMALIGVGFRRHDHHISKTVRAGLEAGASIGFVGDEEAFNNYCALVSPLGTNHRYLGTKFRDELDNLITFLKSQM